MEYENPLHAESVDPNLVKKRKQEEEERRKREYERRDRFDKFNELVDDEKIKYAPMVVDALLRKAKDCESLRSDNKRLWNIVNEKNREQFRALGRIHKYEDTVKEALGLAVQANMSLKCDSKFIGVYCDIREYVTTKGEYALASYLDGKYRGRAKKGEKKSYDGVFLYKDYKEQFDKYLIPVKSFERLQDLFQFKGCNI
jgi:hypothetical protein